MKIKMLLICMISVLSVLTNSVESAEDVKYRYFSSLNALGSHGDDLYDFGEFLFVGEVVEERNLIPGEFDEPKPFTEYSVNVMRNLRGELKEEVQVIFNGGIDEEGFSVIEKGMSFLEVGDVYLFNLSYYGNSRDSRIADDTLLIFQNVNYTHIEKLNDVKKWTINDYEEYFNDIHITNENIQINNAVLYDNSTDQIRSVVMHEIGHGLGLKHMHNTGDSANLNLVISELNTNIMNYNAPSTLITIGPCDRNAYYYNWR